MVAGLALTSCAGIQRQTAQPAGATPAATPAVTSATSNSLPAPPAAVPAISASDLNRKLLGQMTSAENESDLPLGPGDLIEVSVFDVQELSGLKLRISNSGNITLPLIGTLPAAGLGAVEVPRAGSFYVRGEVNRPGSFLLKARTTLDQVPAVTGGVKDAADWDDIRVYRARPDGTRDVMTFSLNEFEKGKPAPEVQANDVVVVGKSYTKAFLYGVRDFFHFGVGPAVPIP